MKKMIFPIAALLLVSCNASDKQNEGTTSLSVHSVDTMVETVCLRHTHNGRSGKKTSATARYLCP